MVVDIFSIFYTFLYWWYGEQIHAIRNALTCILCECHYYENVSFWCRIFGPLRFLGLTGRCLCSCCCCCSDGCFSPNWNWSSRAVCFIPSGTLVFSESLTLDFYGIKWFFLDGNKEWSIQEIMYSRFFWFIRPSTTRNKGAVTSPTITCSRMLQ